MLSIIRLGMVIGSGAALKRTLLYAHGTIVQVGAAPACRGQLQSVYRRAKHVVQGFRDLGPRCAASRSMKTTWPSMVQLSVTNTPWIC
jgi:hypothetical protein